MKCHLCVNYIEMQTDPANCDYVIVSGASRKEERWDMEDNEQVLTTGEYHLLPIPHDPRLLPQSHTYVVLAEHEKKEKLETDAMFRLEHGEADRSTLKKALPTLSHIQEAQNAWKDDFALNSMLRRHFRVRETPRETAADSDLCPHIPPASWSFPVWLHAPHVQHRSRALPRSFPDAIANIPQTGKCILELYYALLCKLDI